MADAGEGHEPTAVTVNVYVPAVSPVIVVVVPVPVVTTAPGFLVSVQLPAGSPLRSTEPVAVAQSG